MPEIVECVDDNEAVDKAMQLANGLALEIWDHKRRVARISEGPAKGIGRLSLAASLMFGAS